MKGRPQSLRLVADCVSTRAERRPGSACSLAVAALDRHPATDMAAHGTLSGPSPAPQWSQAWTAERQLVCGRYPGLGLVADYVQSALSEALAALVGMPSTFLAAVRRARAPPGCPCAPAVLACLRLLPGACIGYVSLVTKAYHKAHCDQRDVLCSDCAGSKQRTCGFKIACIGPCCCMWPVQS